MVPTRVGLVRLFELRCEGEWPRLFVVIEDDDGRALGVLGEFDVKEEREGFELGGGGLRLDEAMLMYEGCSGGSFKSRVMFA